MSNWGYVNAVVGGASYGQAAYFRSVKGDPEQQFAVTADRVDEGSSNGRISIADFKKNAVCQERAGVAHNTLLILGLKSKLHAGKLSRINEAGSVRTGPHAFITFKSATGAEYIFDPTNPIIIRDGAGDIIDINPSIYKRELGAKEQTVEMGDFQRKPNGDSRQLESQKVTYTFED